MRYDEVNRVRRRDKMCARKSNKTGAVAVALAMTLLCGVGLAGERRSFTDVLGREINAEIIEYDAESQTVVLKRRNGSSGVIPLNALSRADQEYIVKWASRRGFLDTQAFEIRIEENTTRWEATGDNDGGERKFTRFIIHLTNNSSFKLENIRAGCCLYRDYEKYIGTAYYEILMDDLEAGETTQANSRIKHVSARRTPMFLNEVVGARFRFYMVLDDGSEIMRETCVPKVLSAEKYPWKEGGKAEREKQKQLPDPTSYPDKEMTAQEVKSIIKAYIRALEKKDFNAWSQLLSPMHPGASELNEIRFNYPAHNIKSMKIKDIDGLNARISVEYKNQRSVNGWLQIHSSGYIKYEPCIIRHPVKKASQSLTLLLSEDQSLRKAGVYALEQAKVPLCGYETNASKEDRKGVANRILDWLAENGADHDSTEPNVLIPLTEFRQCIRDARSSISNYDRDR